MTSIPWRYLGLEAAKRMRYAYGYIKAPLLLRLLAGDSSQGSLVVGRVPKFANRGTLILGKEFRTRSTVHRIQVSVGKNGRLEIGDRVSLNQGVCIHAERHVRIGNRVQVGDLARIHDTNFHWVRPGSEVRVEPVTIEDDVWIGVGAIVLPGVTIGRGSVIGSGAVVTKSCEPGSVVTGPAAAIRARFDVSSEFRRR